MILLLDLCYSKNSLSKYEFVDPIAKDLCYLDETYEIKHFSELSSFDSLKRYNGVILCGTALMDYGYADNLDRFSWIVQCTKPVLGICAGMQVIGSVFGGDIISCPAIGLKKTEIVAPSRLLGDPRIIEGYQLHNLGVTVPKTFTLLAGKQDQPEAFMHSDKTIYGVSFHPEVRNRWVIENFSALCK